MTGSPIVIGDDRQPCECLIQMAGEATRAPASALTEAMTASSTLRLFLLRYVQSQSIQTTFTALALRVRRLVALEIRRKTNTRVPFSYLSFSQIL
jgi:hypothetical protein